jgi:hypothetical protein
MLIERAIGVLKISLHSSSEILTVVNEETFAFKTKPQVLFVNFRANFATNQL